MATSQAAPGMLFIASTYAYKIAQMNMSTFATTTFAGATSGSADGTGTSATFSTPSGLAGTGTLLLVGDTWNHAIRAVTVPGAVVTTLAGLKGTCGYADGVGTNARFCAPSGLALSPDEKTLYIADGGLSAQRNNVTSWCG